MNYEEFVIMKNEVGKASIEILKDKLTDGELVIVEEYINFLNYWSCLSGMDGGFPWEISLTKKEED